MFAGTLHITQTTFYENKKHYSFTQRMKMTLKPFQKCHFILTLHVIFFHVLSHAVCVLSRSVVSLCSAFSPVISFPLNPNQAQQMGASSSVWFCWKSLSVKRDFLLLTISSAYSYGVALLLLSEVSL